MFTAFSPSTRRSLYSLTVNTIEWAVLLTRHDLELHQRGAGLRAFDLVQDVLQLPPVAVEGDRAAPIDELLRELHLVATGGEVILMRPCIFHP